MFGLDLIANVAASAIYDIGKTLLGSREVKETFDKKDIEKALHNHLKEVLHWSAEIKHRGMVLKTTEHHYIQLKYFSTPNRQQYPESVELAKPLNLKTQFENSVSNTIILGQPGAGKTTSSKYIAFKIITDEDFCAARYKFPVLVRFSDLKSFGRSPFGKDNASDWQGAELLTDINESRTTEYEGIFQHLFSIFGIKGLSHVAEKDTPLLEKFIIEILEENHIFLILEGFDEYPFDDRSFLIREVRKISLRCRNSSFLLTSRTADFPYTIDNADTFEIAPLDNDQIREFANNWLKDPSKANIFYNQLLASTYLDTARRPLTLSHLLTIFDKSNPHTIPRKPNAIYAKVVELLIREWDEENNRRRHSKYSFFQAERKKAFLCKLSFYLTKNYFGTTFTSHQLRVQYLDLCESFELPKDESYKVLNELESHNGLFIKSGSDRFEFAHKSIQEYFTAEYLKGLPRLSDKFIELRKIPNELAILVALATEPNDYLIDIIDIIIRNKYYLEFVSPFVSRIGLENPDFTVSQELAESLLKLYTFVNFSNQNIDDKKKCLDQLSNLIINHSIINRSTYELEKSYSLDSQTSIELIQATKNPSSSNISFEDNIQIFPIDGKRDSLYCKLAFISKWTYIRPYFEVWLKNNQSTLIKSLTNHYVLLLSC